MYCRKCGSALEDGDRFCDMCGCEVITGEDIRNSLVQEKTALERRYYDDDVPAAAPERTEGYAPPVSAQESPDYPVPSTNALVPVTATAPTREKQPSWEYSKASPTEPVSSSVSTGKNHGSGVGAVIGNILWFLLGGLIEAIAWFLAGILWCITLIGIPIGKQCFKFAKITIAPFGKEIVYGGKAGSVILNIFWIILVGFWSAVAYAVTGVAFCITIIGIPFGLQYFKFAKLMLMPFGAKVIKKGSNNANEMYVENMNMRNQQYDAYESQRFQQSTANSIH